MSLVNGWKIHVAYLDSAETMYEHWNARDYLVFAGDVDAALAIVREHFPRCRVDRVENAYLGEILGLTASLEDLARAQYPDGLLCSDKCRLGEHRACYGTALGLLPDGQWSRPCECPCHATSEPTT